MTAPVLFFISAVLCCIGAYVAIFTVTLHRSYNAWVSCAFLAGAFLNVVLFFTHTTT